MAIVHENEHGVNSNKSDEIEVVRRHAEKYSVPDLMTALFPLDAKPWYT